MKFLRLFLAFFFFAGPVHARTAVLVDRAIPSAASAVGRGVTIAIDNNTVALTTGFIQRFNPNTFDVWNMDALQTNAGGHPTTQIQTGLINGVQYDAVIIANWNGAAFNSRAYTNCWACSLTFATKAPTVPVLFIGAGQGESPFNTANTASARCSTGATGSQEDPGSQGPSYAGGLARLIGTPYAWKVFGAPAADMAASSLAGMSGTFRMLIGYGYGCEETALGVNLPTDAGDCEFRDSLVTMTSDCSGCTAGTDATGGLLWVRHMASGFPIIFARWQSHAITGRGGLSGDETTIGGDPGVLYAGIALLDSLSGFKVLGTSKPDPVKVAFQIDGAGDYIGGTDYVGGWTAGAGTNWTGAVQSDDGGAFVASCESLTVRKIKVTFGVDVLRATVHSLDASTGIIAAQIAAFKSMPYAHFSPVCNTRIAGGNGGSLNGRAWFKEPVDAWGYSRVRTIFNGPVTSQLSAGGIVYDSSRVALFKGSFWLIDSIFGAGRRGTIAMPARNNWSSVDMATAPNIDSLIYAARAGGFTGVSSDAEGDTLKTATGYPWANGSGQRMKANRLGSGEPFMFLTYPGRSLTVVDSQEGIGYGDNDNCHSAAYIYRAMLGLILPQWMFQERRVILTGEQTTFGENGQNASGMGLFGAISPNANTNTGVNLLRFTCAGLGSGGRRGQAVATPDRPDYWTMVHLKNEFDAINHLGGRKLFDVVWDSELGPRDIRR